MSKSPHVCKYWQPSRRGHRGHRWCDWCGRRQVSVQRGEDLVWEDRGTIEKFGGKWLPTVSGTDPKAMLFVQVAFPFEFNSCESWDIVYRVKFNLPSELVGLTTTDIMNGWQSGWHTCWNHIDAEADAYYAKVTGHPYVVGDNCRAEMRAIIQAPFPPDKGPELSVVKP